MGFCLQSGTHDGPTTTTTTTVANREDGDEIDDDGEAREKTRRETTFLKCVIALFWLAIADLILGY